MQRIIHNSCPFCHSNDIIKSISLTDHKISKSIFSIADCNSCKLRFTQDPPIESECAPFYDSPRYISHSDNTDGLINRLYHTVRSTMLRKKLALIQNLTSKKKILDIGSGTGYFLNTMKIAGYQTAGIEINEKARDFSRKNFSLDVYPPEDFSESKLQGKFDIASMWHVLEHIYEPKKYLNQIHSYLEEDAFLIIAVPNYTSADASVYKEYWAGYDVPRHLWHFSPITLKNLVENSGFKLIKLSRLPFDSFYVSMLSESYKQSVLASIRGAFIGLISWAASLFNIQSTSSIIYIFQKSNA